MLSFYKNDQISQACRPVVKGIGMWGSVKALARGYEYMMGVFIFAPVAILAWFPFVSEFQTRLLFNQAFSRGLQIQRILAGGKKQAWHNKYRMTIYRKKEEDAGAGYRGKAVVCNCSGNTKVMSQNNAYEGPVVIQIHAPSFPLLFIMYNISKAMN